MSDKSDEQASAPADTRSVLIAKIEKPRKDFAELVAHVSYLLLLT